MEKSIKQSKIAREKTTITGKKITITGEKTMIARENTTIAGEKTMIASEKTTITGKKTTINRGKNKVTRIRKRDASLVPFDASKIENAILRALQATKSGGRELAAETTQKALQATKSGGKELAAETTQKALQATKSGGRELAAETIQKALQATNSGGKELAAELTGRVVAILESKFAKGIPGVEDIQDIVEEVLMTEGYANVARAYILYREEHADIRRIKQAMGVKDDLKLGINALKVLERRYLLRDPDGNLIESPRDLFHRVAHAIASIETRFQPSSDIHGLEQKFFDLMNNLEFLPNTPTLMNAGAPLGQLSACFVLPVEDSIVDIFDSLKNMALIHQSGGGTGFTFSHLRPKGDMVRSTKGVASGPVSFMKVFDVATGVMKQGGKRRGANMGILNANHADIMEFVLAKSDESTLSNFNISVGASDEFMEAVKKGGKWPLINPRTNQEVRVIKARELFDLMVNNAWRSGDPGLIFLDEINRRTLVTDWDIKPEWHVKMQAVFQKYSDNSVSKTVNLPAEATPDDIRRIYIQAYDLKCKGITVYRYGSKKDQVLTLPSKLPEPETDKGPYLTVDSEYSGGCTMCGRGT